MDREFSITFIRHAQAQNNLVFDQNDVELPRKIYDSSLTDYGIEQAHKLHNVVNKLNFDIIYVSPLERTLKTSSIIFGDTKIPIYSNELLREYKDSYANYRTSISEKKEKYPIVNFDQINSDNDVMEDEIEKRRKILCFNQIIKTKAEYMIDRVYNFIKILSEGEHRNICIVSHLGFIYMFGHLLNYNLRPSNCQISKIRVKL